MQRAPGRRWRFALAMIAIAGAAAASVSLLVARRPQRAPATSLATGERTFHAAVTGTPTARFARESGAPDEVIRLYDGSLTVDVTPLRRGDRVRIVIGDAEVEARDTSFEVSARGDSLDAVQVVRGQVDVRPARMAPVVIVAGERWDARPIVDRDTIAELPAEPPRVESPATPREKHDVRQSPPARSLSPSANTNAAPAEPPMSKLFATGWQAFHAGDPANAVSAFDEALAAYPGDPLAEDVSFWRAMALQKISTTQARDAFAQFISRYPRSPRLGEASLVFGWLELDAGHLDQAVRSFERARKDPDDTVRSNAEKGLAAVTSARAH